jgi:phytoene synthase
VSAARAGLVEAARVSIARGSKSFALASRLFGTETRERVWMLYAWCRACDDLADGQDHGGAMERVDDAQARVDQIRRMTAAALAGETTGNAAFDAIGQLSREVALPRALTDDVIAGFQLDADGWQPRTESDLMQYCYHVAGAVGCLMALVMGVPANADDTLDRACDLGLAFQLANIARDVAEDARADRCYLPADWLADAGIDTDAIMDPAHRPALAALGARLADMAAAYEASARSGTAALPFRSAWAVSAAATIYGDIAREVRRRGSAAWDRRVVTSRGAKIAALGGGLWQASRRHTAATPPRAGGLWTRPRHA